MSEYMKSKILNITFTKKSLGKLIKSEPKARRKKIDKAVSIELEDLKQHFKKDKWDLDYSFYKDYIVQRLLGYDASWSILYRIVNAGYTVCSGRDGKLVIRKPNGKSKTKKRN